MFDVGNEMTSEELAKEVYMKNKECWREEEYKEGARIVNRRSRKGMHVGNVVMEVKANAGCVGEGRVYVK